MGKQAVVGEPTATGLGNREFQGGHLCRMGEINTEITSRGESP